MSHILVSELLVNAFSEDALVDIEQDLTLPPIPSDKFLEYLDEPNFDYRASFISQKSLILDTAKGKYRIEAKLLNYCYFVDLLFDEIEHKSDIEIKIYEPLLSIKPLLVKLLVKDPRFIQSSKHYLRQFMDDVFHIIIPWSTSLGERGEDVLLRWKNVIDVLHTIQGTEDELPQQLKDTFKDLAQFEQNALKTEERSRKEEEQQRKKSQTKRKVDSLLDQQMENKKLPPSIVHFLTHEWRSSLYTFHKRALLVDYTWEDLSQFTHDMLENFSVDSTCNKLTIIPEIKPKLEKYLTVMDEDKKRVLREIDRINGKILNNQTLDWIIATPLLEENRSKKLKISTSVLKVAEKLKYEQWIHYKDKNINLKVAQIYSNPKSFLLVDFFGNTVTTKNHHALAYELISKQAKLLTSKNVFNKSFVHTLETYLHLYKQKRKEDSELKREIERAEEERKQEALRKAQVEAEHLRQQKENVEQKLYQEADQLRQRQKELQSKVINVLEEQFAQQAKKILLEKERERAEAEQLYLQEAEKIRIEKEMDKAKIEEKLTREVEQLKQKKIETEQESQREMEALLREKEKLERELQEKSNENRRYQIIEQVKTLTIGSWLCLPDNKQEDVTCKIAIIYPSTGKYVFVDTNGIRIMELTAEEIVAHIYENKARIVKTESSFDNSMQEVIKSLRK